MVDFDDVNETHWFKPILVIGMLTLILFIGVTQGFIPLKQSILPGFEGMQNGLYGYQPAAKVTASLGNPLSAPNTACAYAWNGNPTISAASIEAKSVTASTFGCTFPVSDKLDLAAQENPVSYSDPFTTPIQVNYGVPVPGTTNKVQYVTGNVEVYTYVVSLAIEPSSSGNWDFSGDTVWLNLASLVWNTASTDPNNSTVTGPTFEAPLYGVVTNVHWTDAKDSNCNLCTIGSALTFYSSPTTTGQTLVTLTQNQPPSSDLANSLSSQYAPDTRMQRLVYYPLVIDHLQNDCGLGICHPPTVTMTIKLYTLRIGEYLLTNPDTTQLQPPPTVSCSGPLSFTCDIGAGIQNFLANPFNLLALGGLGIIAVIVIIAVLSPELILGILYLRRKD